MTKPVAGCVSICQDFGEMVVGTTSFNRVPRTVQEHVPHIPYSALRRLTLEDQARHPFRLCAQSRNRPIIKLSIDLVVEEILHEDGLIALDGDCQAFLVVDALSGAVAKNVVRDDEAEN